MKNLKNILLICCCWIAAYISLYMYQYQAKYNEPFSVYVTSLISGASSFGYLLQHPISAKINLKRTQFVAFGLVTFLLIITFVDDPINDYVYVGLLFCLRVSVCLLYGHLLISHLELFDTNFLATSYGICNIVSRFAHFSVPLIDIFYNKTCLFLLVMGLNIIALVATNFMTKQIQK